MDATTDEARRARRPFNQGFHAKLKFYGDHKSNRSLAHALAPGSSSPRSPARRTSRLRVGLRRDHSPRSPTTRRSTPARRRPPARRRRPRYSGSYPKRFGERYKEHAGDAATLQRVREKGGTPAGTHVPIMVRECLDAMGLDAYDDEAPLLVVDCTLGFGGHSAAILARLSRRRGAGRLLALDVDPLEMPRTEARLRAHSCRRGLRGGGVALKCERRNFGELGAVLRAAPSGERRAASRARALADLGCSSMQIDDPSRGFTYKAADAPLDMRMDPR